MSLYHVSVVDHPMRPSPPRPDATPCYKVTEIHRALSTSYVSDAHCVCYTCASPDGMHHRLRKDFAAEYPYPPVLSLLMADVDNDPHVPWTDATMAAANPVFVRLISEGFGVYTTNKGYRVICLLPEPIPALDAEPFIRALHFKLYAMGVAADPSCKDWTRHYRLPLVTRQGKPTSSRILL